MVYMTWGSNGISLRVSAGGWVLMVYWRPEALNLTKSHITHPTFARRAVWMKECMHRTAHSSDQCHED